MSVPPPVFTVLFATRNGAHVLPRVLDGYRRAARHAPDWKLVVVDNGSDDGTATILNAAVLDLPLEIMSVATPGKNRALNAGVAAVSGKFTILTDDDAIPSDTFLSDWRNCIEAEPDYAVFGGSITPLFEARPSEWLLRDRHGLAMLFAERTVADGEVGWDLIYGPNMAVRQEVFDAGFRFDERVGPDGTGDYAMGSESEFCRRVARAKYRFCFASRPTVSHIVRPYQLVPAYWRARAFRSGLGRAYMLSTATESERRLPAFHTSKQMRRAEELRDLVKTMSWRAGDRFQADCARQFRRGFEEGWKRYEKVLIGRDGKPEVPSGVAMGQR